MSAMPSVLPCCVYPSPLKQGNSPKRSSRSFPPKKLPNAASLKTQSKPLHRNKSKVPHPPVPLHRRNPHSLCQEVQRLARQGCLKEALAVMAYMDHAGIPANATALSALISACLPLKSLPFARRIHAHLRLNSLDTNEFLRKKLLLLYAACGSFQDARNLFDESPLRDVRSWNALIRGTVVSGGKNIVDVVSIYNQMCEFGVEMDCYTVANVIKCLAGASAVKLGFATHAVLVKKGFLSNDLVKTCLIDLYFKCGRMNLAHQLFQEICVPDVVVWGAMVAGFAHNKRNLEALDYVRWMVREGKQPNSVILTSVLPSIGELSEKKLGREVHAFVLKKKCSGHVSVQCALIDMYCKCGDMVAGRRVFYQSPERNEVTWTALISGYASNGLFEQALRSVVWMQQEGIKPDVVTVATVIPVCKEMKKIKEGKELHAYAIKNVFLPNVSISTSLMKLYSQCGEVEYSERIFNGMEKRNVISWTAMIDAHINSGKPREGLEAFRSLIRSQHNVDSVVTARMVSICGELEELKMGKEIHAQAMKRKFESIPFVVAEVIRMYGRCGRLGFARAAFDSTGVKGSIAWTAMIEAYGLNEEAQRGMEMFEAMVKKRIAPTRYTFNVALAVCHRGGLSDEAVRLLRMMSGRNDVPVGKDHYSLVIGLLRENGREDEARAFSNLRSLLP